MNTNLALQNPIKYKYKKQNSKQKTKNKLHKKNSTHSIITIVIIVISSYFITHNFYISLNSQNLYFAVEYNFTNNDDKDNSLVRVQHMTLISSDGENATVKASGLSKSRPHHTISLIGTFAKDDNDIWRLKEISNDDLP